MITINTVNIDWEHAGFIATGPHGSIHLGDPCYFHKDHDFSTVYEKKHVMKHLSLTEIEDAEQEVQSLRIEGMNPDHEVAVSYVMEDQRVKALRLELPHDMESGPLSDFELVTVLTVDTGNMAVMDAASVLEAQTIDHRSWGSICDDLVTQGVFSAAEPANAVIGYTKDGHRLPTLISSTGWGDGAYPVYARKTPKGEIAQLIIVFIEEDEA